MPLQGLDDNTKKVVLERLIKGECSLKDLQATCSSIKRKKKISQFGVATAHPNDAFCVGIKSSWKITSSQDYRH